MQVLTKEELRDQLVTARKKYRWLKLKLDVLKIENDGLKSENEAIKKVLEVLQSTCD